jgi:hypothetical protein
MINYLSRRDGAEISPPAYDALVRKRTSVATFTDLPNLFTFCLYLPLPCMPLIAMHAFHCHACLPLPCMPSIAMHASHCHACLSLPCMPSIAMHASYCHACLPLPCISFTAMHASHCHACQDIPTGNKRNFKRKNPL